MTVCILAQLVCWWCKKTPIYNISHFVAHSVRHSALWAWRGDLRVHTLQCISNSIDIVLLSRNFDKYAFDDFHSFGKIASVGKREPKTNFLLILSILLTKVQNFSHWSLRYVLVRSTAVERVKMNTTHGKMYFVVKKAAAKNRLKICATVCVCVYVLLYNFIIH